MAFNDTIAVLVSCALFTIVIASSATFATPRSLVLRQENLCYATITTWCYASVPPGVSPRLTHRSLIPQPFFWRFLQHDMWGYKRGSKYLSTLPTYVHMYTPIHSEKMDKRLIFLQRRHWLWIRRVIGVQVVLPYRSNARSVISEKFVSSLIG